MTTIARRIKAIEQASAKKRGGFTCVLEWDQTPITGAVTWGCNGDWEREPGETVEAFRARVLDQAEWPPGGGQRVIQFLGEPGGWSDAELL